MTVKFRSKNPPGSDVAIAALVDAIGMPLPDDYVDFIRQSDGGRPTANEFDVAEDNASGVLAFFSLAQVLDERAALRDRLGATVWPVADAEGGNLVCLEHTSNGWSVVFWDHETEELTFLSSSFSQFLLLLRKFDPSSVRLEPGQVKSAWIDPKLLKGREK